MANEQKEQTRPIGGFVSLTGGAHAGVAPEVLSETAYSRGINVSSREGLVQTRPGFMPESVVLPTGVFQGMVSWYLHSGARIVIGLGGKLAVYAVETGVLTTFETDLSPTEPFYFCQAERFFVVQDGIHEAVVLQEVDGAVERRAEPHSIPIGRAMAFSQGRLHVNPDKVGTENGRPYLQSGDIFDPADPARCLNFTEDMYLNEGGAHSVPVESGYLYAFAPLRNAGTGTGYGNLIAFSRRGVSAYDMSVGRDQWKDEDIVQVLYFGPGTRSPWSVVPINGTLMYRSLDGLRLLSYAVTSAQDTGGNALANVPQSSEVGPYMTRADRSYLPRVSAAVVDNRAFMTCGGTGGVWFKAIVVVDFARISSIQSPQTEVAYDGIWQIEGKSFGGICACAKEDEEILYAYMSDGRLWRLDPDAVTDDQASIRSRLVTRTLLLDSPDNKRVAQVNLWLRGLTRDTTIQAYSRPMGYPLWLDLGSLSLKVAEGSLPQRRRALSLAVPWTDSAADPVSEEYLTIGQGHQFALEWTGPAVIEMFRVLGEFVPEPASSPCPETEARRIVAVTNGVDLGEYL